MCTVSSLHPTQRSYDYVLVSDKVEDQEDHKFMKQMAFIDQLKKKNMKITVSFFHISIYHHDISSEDMPFH